MLNDARISDDGSAHVYRRAVVQALKDHVQKLTSLCHEIKSKYEVMCRRLEEETRECEVRSRQAGNEVVAMCSVCLLRPANRVIIPCCHVASCRVCDIHLGSCPICRKSIMRSIEVNLLVWSGELSSDNNSQLSRSKPNGTIRFLH